MRTATLASALLAAFMPPMRHLDAILLGSSPNRRRGKGRYSPARNFLRGAFNNKYTPHQGKQECARRAARIGG